MAIFEYKVVPAPTRGVKAKGVKGTAARFAHALQDVMNELGAQGWEYQRTDTLPVEERQGLTGKTSSFQNMLVFRRVVEGDAVDVPMIEDATVATDERPVEDDLPADPAPQAEDAVTAPAPDTEATEPPSSPEKTG